jgi:hypothetical protein
VKGRFVRKELSSGPDSSLQPLQGEERGRNVRPRAEALMLDSLVKEFPALFSDELGTAKCGPYDIELSDTKPVRSVSYRCAPPNTKVFCEMIEDLLAKGVIRPCKSPYASPAFLVPKRGAVTAWLWIIGR